ncbi:hypothetical protein PRZ48_012903 [Zasmidium cellare]|uniref:Uncharacterized protein n=1 Tax=Zasmidium cellare TaxID=395010 RepID=A0ABR0E2K5_ZASCE|nr:hypothetical protein PRZ48_012903 [Zasmidium cellare]
MASNPNNDHKLSAAAGKAYSKIEPSTFGGSEAMEVNIAGNQAPPPQDHNDPLHDKEHDSAHHQHKEGLLGRLKSHLPGGHSKETSSEGSVKEGKRESIADSGPYVFAFDPKQGKEVLQKNPHWPNEDSWKREKEVEGQWAFGSMAGQQNKDFGGSVG